MKPLLNLNPYFKRINLTSFPSIIYEYTDLVFEVEQFLQHKLINYLYTDLTLFISIILLGLVPPEFGS